MEELMNFLKDTFSIFDLDPAITVPRYNIAPGQDVLAVIHSSKGYRAGHLRWGLVPSFSKDEKVGYKMINARSETLTSRPSFKQSFQSKRCVILADGFYEWKRDGSQKRPMLIQLKDRRMFMFAGLWSSFKRDDGSILYTTTIITTKANEMMSDIHDRMPVILDAESAFQWLDETETDPTTLQDLLVQYRDEDMTFFPVSSIVNNAKNDSIECIKPLQENSFL
jgi:putative SOS response-associated peptidase YedK